MCNQAREAREKGDSDQANRYVDEALRQRPDDIETRRQLAETLWTNGRKDEAIAQYTSLCDQRRKDAKLWSRLAAMQWEANQHLAAVNTAKAVLQLDPQSKEALQVKARNEVAEGQLDEALASYIKLSQIDSNDLLILVELGQLHLLRGHPDRACPILRKAIQHPLASTTQRADIEWSLGVAYARSERWSVAVTALERAIVARDATADDWCFLAWARMQGGDLAGAQADLQKALKNDPESVAARKLTRQLEDLSDNSPMGDRVTPASFRSNE